MRSQWHQGGEPRSKRNEKRGDPEKIPMVFISVACFWTQNAEQIIGVYVFLRKFKSREKRRHVGSRLAGFEPRGGDRRRGKPSF